MQDDGCATKLVFP